MNESKIVIVDEDADFCRRLDGVLREKLPFPVSVHSFTDMDAFGAYADRDGTAALLISETSIRGASLTGFPSVIILSEGLGYELTGDNIRCVSKFRRLSSLVSDITATVMSSPSFVLPIPEKNGTSARLIGFFTPLSRCLQTTASITMGQRLAERGKTLYLSFEPFSGLPETLCNPTEGGLSELLYYFDCEPKKLGIYTERMRMQVGKLDVIAPADTFSAIMEIDTAKWREFFAALKEKTDYKNIICDLSVCMSELPQLLCLFDRVITIERSDPISREKLYKWDRFLKRSGHEELSSITRRISFPAFNSLPADPARYGEGILAEFIACKLKDPAFIGDLDADT